MAAARTGACRQSARWTLFWIVAVVLSMAFIDQKLPLGGAVTGRAFEIAAPVVANVSLALALEHAGAATGLWGSPPGRDHRGVTLPMALAVWSSHPGTVLASTFWVVAALFGPCRVVMPRIAERAGAW